MLYRLYSDPVTRASSSSYEYAGRLTSDSMKAVFRHYYTSTYNNDAQTDAEAAQNKKDNEVELDEKQCSELLGRLTQWRVKRPLLMMQFLLQAMGDEFADPEGKAKSVHRALYNIQEHKRTNGIPLDAPAVSKPPETPQRGMGLTQLRDPGDRGPQRRF
ncbi:MAG: hypothetical protein EBQ96_01725 [Proteobacteria bacterium]|nr:hypothetical protein [Pseudomonadota bacterium]